MRSILALVVATTLLSSIVRAQEAGNPLDDPQRAERSGGYTPPDGFVPNARTAIAIGRAVLITIYGAKKIAAEGPLNATLTDETWIVSGRLPRGAVGGVAEAHIKKADGQIVYVAHGK